MALWERRASESIEQYHWFCRFQLLDPRTWQTLRQISFPYGEKVWRTWSSAHQWVKRAEAWDTHILDSARAKIEAERRDELYTIGRAKELRQRLGMRMMIVADEELQRVLETIRSAPMSGTIKPRDAIASGIAGAKLVEDVDAVASDEVESPGLDKWLETASVDEIRALHERAAGK